MKPYIAIARTTARQVIGGKRLIGFVLLILAPAGIIWLATGNQGVRSATRNIIEVTVGTFFVVAIPVVAIMLAATALGADRRDSTISFIALRPLSRPFIGLAKILGSLVTAFALTGLGALAIGIVAVLRIEEAGYIVPLLVGTLVATLAYGTILVPLGYVTERASVIGLAYVFIWESAIAGTIPGLAWTSMWRTGFMAFVALAPEGTEQIVDDFALGDLTPSLGGSLTRAIVLTAIATVVTGWLLRTRDLV
jgi:ABC-type transport system involved in multi-copper enzyme maturation permease subunit